MQCAGHVSLFGAQAHQPVACFFVRGIEIYDRPGQPFLVASVHTIIEQAGLEPTHQPIVERLALG